MHQVERITRAAVREALDRAKLRKLAPVVPVKAPQAPAPVPIDPPVQPQPRGDVPTAPQAVPQPLLVPEAMPGSSDESVPPRAAKPKTPPSHPQPPGDEEQADPYEDARRAVQAVLGLPVRVHAPHAGKPGELRISFADLMELEALRQNLT